MVKHERAALVTALSLANRWVRPEVSKLYDMEGQGQNMTWVAVLRAKDCDWKWIIIPM